jgi:hypothetical protein
MSGSKNDSKILKEKDFHDVINQRHLRLDHLLLQWASKVRPNLDKDRSTIDIPPKPT